MERELMHSQSYEAPTHDAGGTVMSRPALGAFTGFVQESPAEAGPTRSGRSLLPVGPASAGLLRLVLLIVLLIGSWPALAQTPVGTTIQNIATVTYGDSANRTSIASNAVSAVVTNAPTLSSLAILRAVTAGPGMPVQVNATQCRSASGVSTLPAPRNAAGEELDLAGVVTLSGTASLHGGEAAFLQLTDADRNLDATVIDTVELRVSTPAGDRETLYLAETGVDTGVFAGYIQTRAASAAAGNCVLEVARNASISSIYVDPVDASDTSNASALVDPYGLVFDSATGAPIDGARVRLVDASSGAAATVYGDDGVSRYPSEMVTGSAVTDDGGSSGRLRHELGVLPPGDVRNCLAAVAGLDSPFRDLLQYRFGDGDGPAHDEDEDHDVLELPEQDSQLAFPWCSAEGVGSVLFNEAGNRFGTQSGR